ncbi:MAG: hypothetical protein JWN48_4244, partial [Myxococcaceae bacterium]|nr:hypothetical protein [Myxococcaceae bacterium]
MAAAPHRLLGLSAGDGLSAPRDLWPLLAHVAEFLGHPAVLSGASGIALGAHAFLVAVGEGGAGSASAGTACLLPELEGA